MLFVFPGNILEDVRNVKPLTMGDVAAMSDVFQAPHAQAVAPVVNGRVTASFSGETASVDLFGVTPEYQTVRNYGLIEGDFITEEHINGRSSVALIGPEAADRLFGPC